MSIEFLIAVAVIALAVVAGYFLSRRRSTSLSSPRTQPKNVQPPYGLGSNAGRNVRDLFEGASNGEVETLDRASNAGTNVNARDDSGQTPLMIAAQVGRSDAVRWLLAHGATVDTPDLMGETALMKAVRTGDATIVKILLDAGAATEIEQVEGWTPLIAAALRGNPEIVQLLIARGAAIQTKSVHGISAVDAAQRAGHDQIVRMLRSAAQQQAGRR